MIVYYNIFRRIIIVFSYHFSAKKEKKENSHLTVRVFRITLNSVSVFIWAGDPASRADLYGRRRISAGARKSLSNRILPPHTSSGTSGRQSARGAYICGQRLPRAPDRTATLYMLSGYRTAVFEYLTYEECARDKLVDRTATCRRVRCQSLTDGFVDREDPSVTMGSFFVPLFRSVRKGGI